MPQLFLSYANLTPGLKNKYSNSTHQLMIKKLRKYYLNWVGFSSKYPNSNIGFIVITKKGIKKLEIKGPSISKKYNIVDFSIFLPEVCVSLDEYIKLVFEGISLCLNMYDVNEIEVETIMNECLQEFRE